MVFRSRGFRCRSLLLGSASRGRIDAVGRGRQTYSSGVDRPDLESGRVQGARLLFKLVRCRKGVVSQIDVVLERERDLAMGEEPAGGVLVVQPFEYRLEGVETAIEDEHELRSWRLCLSGRHLGTVYTTSSSRGYGAN